MKMSFSFPVSAGSLDTSLDFTHPKGVADLGNRSYTPGCIVISVLVTDEEAKPDAPGERRARHWSRMEGNVSVSLIASAKLRH